MNWLCAGWGRGYFLLTDDLFAEWLAIGVTQGWVSLPVCDTHNGPPLSEVEAAGFDDGYDPCVLVMRVWPDKKNEDKSSVSPTGTTA